MAKTFPQGIFYSKPREGAPEYVRGSLNFKVDEAVAFLQKHKNAQGYVNIDMLLSKDKALYLALNEWKKPDSMKKGELKETGTNSDGSKTPDFDINPDEVFTNY